jgi:hypothetical protein
MAYALQFAAWWSTAQPVCPQEIPGMKPYVDAVTGWVAWACWRS